MRRSPAYIETPQIRLPPAVNISHQNIRGVHSEHTQNFIYPSLKCKWPIHTKLLAPNDLISLSYRTQYCVWNDNVYYELKKKIDWNILVLPDQCSRTFWASSRYRYRDTMSVSSGDRVITAGTNFCQVCKQWWTMLHNHLTHGSLDKVAATKTTLWLHFVQSSKWWVQQHCENTR